MKFQAKIKQIKEEAEGVKTFILERPTDFTFKVGQYCWIGLPEFNPSPMAIASGVNHIDLEFSIRVGGDLTFEIFRMQSGELLNLDGPHGVSFPISKLQKNQKLYMIGGGTGITPIRSLTYSVVNENKFIFYGAKKTGDLLYKEEMYLWPASVFVVLEEVNYDYVGPRGLVTDLLNEQNLDPEGMCFVCGPKSMEQSVVDFLRNKGFPDDNIYVSLEEFDTDGNVVGPVLPISDPQVEF